MLYNSRMTSNMVYQRLGTKEKINKKDLPFSFEGMIRKAREEGCKNTHEVALWIIDRYASYKSKGYKETFIEINRYLINKTKEV